LKKRRPTRVGRDTARPVIDIGELQQRLAELPPPPSGFARVYRGQTRDYPSLLPSGVRIPVANQKSWIVYTRRLVAKMLGQELASTVTFDRAELDVSGIWIHALAQHYGPGSDFLDVTTDVGTALWFALHKSMLLSVRGQTGPPRKSVDPFGHHDWRFEGIGYVAWEGTGFLYVLDVPMWDSKSNRTAGHLIDLSLAPEPFCRSARMNAQKGCLLYCREGEKAVDMRRFVVEGTPIAVARPLSLTPDSERSIDDLFPRPSVDEWYRHLLSIPFAYQCTVDGSILRRITSVAVYLDPQSKTTQREIMQCNAFIQPPLLNPLLIGGVGWISEDADPPFTREALSNAIGVVLEAPLMSGLAGADSDMWNHDLLVRDLPDDAPTWALSGEALRNERLDNVVFEISPLDSTLFANGPEMVRAVWILRREGKLVVGIFFQQSGKEPSLVGLLEIRFNQQARRLALHVLGESKRIDFLSDWPYVGMPLMACLYVLRHLSSSAVLSPVAYIQMSVGDQTSILVRVSRGAARLVRGSPPGAPQRWYAVRDSKNLEEFFTVSEALLNMLKVDTQGSYADFDVSELHVQAEGLDGTV
jgi:hypothetical protein